jgi:serine/threonine-protein kinase
MDYVEGVTVGELVTAANARPASDGLAPDVGVRIALDACAGLHAAHVSCDELGNLLAPVHRDVSPQNILVGRDGATRVTDFGIAKSLVPERLMTSKNVLKGKVAYMAPEYIMGGDADPRADVFAMGVVTWEMLANARLFRGETDAASMERVRGERAPPLGSKRAGLPAELDAVLEQALAKRPEERFASAQAFAAALETVARAHDMIASGARVARVVEELVGPKLDARREELRCALREADGRELDDDEIATLIMPSPLGVGSTTVVVTNRQPSSEVTG